ncbi:SatD family protein [Methanobacterium alcaliphilum]|uniref:SatD family protein n=1 Tax=Methanobacterium alcaliphilum TaxID=392018 RepID=UPI00200A088A|nr:SatD family protein [Methanobacterium alcaliphilum]MCK9151857.1 SatD family protein [Methanobacterium alcaliphilum]
MNFKAYYILADVLESSKISQKEDFQSKLEKLCHMINSQYSSDFIMSLRIIQGIKQIAGAMKKIENVYQIISLLEDELHPQKIRFVLIQGQLNTSKNQKDISNVYGPIISKSQMMMSDLKKTGLIFNLKIDNPILANAIKWQMNFIFHIKDNWSFNKRKVITEYYRLNNQQKVAEIIDISQQAVSKNLSNSYFKYIQLIESDLIENLKQCTILEDINIDEENLTLNKWLK